MPLPSGFRPIDARTLFLAVSTFEIVGDGLFYDAADLAVNFSRILPGDILAEMFLRFFCEHDCQFWHYCTHT